MCIFIIYISIWFYNIKPYRDVYYKDTYREINRYIMSYNIEAGTHLYVSDDIKYN